MAPDWTQFKRRIYIQAPLEKVYNAWAIPEQLETWFLKKADFQLPDQSLRPKGTSIQKGDTYAWQWHGFDIIEQGEVLKANEKDSLQFTFEDQCIVDVQLSEAEGKTHLILIQSNIPTDEESKMNIYNGCGWGWSFWMVNLKAWLEHNILLNDTFSIPDTQNAAYEMVNY